MSRRALSRALVEIGLMGTVAMLPFGCTPSQPRTLTSAATDLRAAQTKPAAADDKARAFQTRAASELFEWKQVPRIELELPVEAWQSLKAHALEEEYTEARMTFEGVPVGPVGLRMRGGYGTLRSCIDEAGRIRCPKLGMKVKFTHVDADRRFFGLKRLNFTSMIRDSTQMREKISYDLYRSMSVHSPRSAWALLTVNGELLGLFAMVEQIDGTFTDDRWPGNGDGNLFKQAWPLTTEAEYYTHHLRTNEDDGDVRAFIELHEALAKARTEELPETLERFMDLQQLSRYMAVDDAIVNWDGVTTIRCWDEDRYCSNHNFYFYQEEKRPFFWMIPWDLDNTLVPGKQRPEVPHWTVAPADCKARYMVQGDERVAAPGCDPLFRALAAKKEVYQNEVQTLLDGPFSEAALLRQIDRHAAFIADAVAKDPNGPGATAWTQAVERLRADVPLLRERLDHVRHGRAVDSFSLSLKSPNDFETVNSLSLALGVIVQSNSTTTISPLLNGRQALQGRHDVRVEFEFRNDRPPPNGAFSQWAKVELEVPGGLIDVRRLGGLRLLVRGDAGRTLRVVLESNNYEAANKGIHFGWDILLTPDRKLVELRFSKATLPKWAPKTNDKLDVVLASVQGISFRPTPMGRDETGYLPEGKTDRGSFQVDAIQCFGR